MRHIPVLAVIPAVSLALLTISMPEMAAAHSEGACVNNGIESCNAQHPNNYDARLACASSVLNACKNHSHGGGSGVDPASNDFTTGSGQEPSASQRGILLQRR